jgi:hypothetical protein
MWGLWLSTNMLSMHPTLMTIIADDRAQGLRSVAAETRKGRVIRRGTRRFGLLSRRPRRSARVAHA